MRSERLWPARMPSISASAVRIRAGQSLADLLGYQFERGLHDRHNLAAVLRNGFLSNASPENRQTMAVNLTSERVRTALAMLEGIRTGQGLADLLGYQFERGLHDRHNLAEVDQFIFKLRKAFPLRADR